MATEHIGQRNKRITVDVIKKTTSDRAVKDNKLQIVNLSGMSLSTLSTPSLNLATITKLDLSNNNLEVIILQVILSCRAQLFMIYVADHFIRARSGDSRVFHGEDAEFSGVRCGVKPTENPSEFHRMSD